MSNSNMERETLKNRVRNSSTLSGVLLVSLFWAGLLGLVFLKKLSFLVALFYAAMSVITFVVYAVDKSAAVHNRWRISENTLHLLSLFGGWSGALLAQIILRHKSSKESFRFIYWITVLLNLSVFAYYVVVYALA